MVYVLISSVGLMMLSFACRELISGAVVKYNDAKENYSEFHACQDETAAASSAGLPEKYGGVMVGGDAGGGHFTYCVKTLHGHVAVFNWMGSLCRETEIVSGNLTAEVRELVKKGISFNDADNMNKFLEAIR